MRKKGKEPLAWSVCPFCEKAYTFINCRISDNGKNYCLRCGIEKKHLERKVSDVHSAE